MEAKNTIRILKLILTNLDIRADSTIGLCNIIFNLSIDKEITDEERKNIRFYLFINRPDTLIHRECVGVYSGVPSYTHYWYPLTNIQSRIDWINNQINKLEHGFEQ